MSRGQKKREFNREFKLEEVKLSHSPFSKGWFAL